MNNANSTLYIHGVLREHFISKKQSYLTVLKLQEDYGLDDIGQCLSHLKSEGVNLVKIELPKREPAIFYFKANDKGLIVHTQEQLRDLLMTVGQYNDGN